MKKLSIRDLLSEVNVCPSLDYFAQLKQHYEVLANQRLNRIFAIFLIVMGFQTLFGNVHAIVRNEWSYLHTVSTVIVVLGFPLSFLLGKRRNEKNFGKISLQKKMQQASQLETMCILCFPLLFILNIYSILRLMGEVPPLSLNVTWTWCILTVPILALLIKLGTHRLAKYWDPDWFE
jgi:uncharacterized membrane protein